MPLGWTQSTVIQSTITIISPHHCDHIDACCPHSSLSSTRRLPLLRAGDVRQVQWAGVTAEVKVEWRGNYIELDEEMDVVGPVPRLGVLLGLGRAAAQAEMKAAAEAEAAAEAAEDGKEEAEIAAEQPIVSQIDPPPPPVDDEQRFIETYVRDNCIHANYKWPEHRMAHLSDAAVRFTPSIRTMDVVLKRKIVAYVRAEHISEDVDMSAAV
jgi:hypothetical protein